MGALLGIVCHKKIGLTSVSDRGSSNKNGFVTGVASLSKQWSLSNKVRLSAVKHPFNQSQQLLTPLVKSSPERLTDRLRDENEVLRTGSPFNEVDVTPPEELPTGCQYGSVP